MVPPRSEAAAARERSPNCSNQAQRGMASISKKFPDIGAAVYVDAEKVRDSNKAL